MTKPTTRSRLLFVHDDNPQHPLSSFFAQDLEILERRYDVEVLSKTEWDRRKRALADDIW